MILSIRSIEAVPPAVVIRGPSTTNTDLVSFTSSNSSAKLSWFSQWIVALRPSRSPAIASVCAAVHRPPITGPFRASRRSHEIRRRDEFCATSMPPQTRIVSSRDSSARSMSSARAMPLEQVADTPPSPHSIHE